MLKAEIDSRSVHLEGSGGLEEVIGDVVQIAGALYAQMMTADPEAASEFRSAVTALFVDHESPVWQMSPAVGGIASVIPVEAEDA
jgi:hypothetical protein